MGYPKDYIELNDSRDYPVLRRVLRSGFVTHSQLFRFMEIAGSESSRQSFNWRVSRLVEHGLILRLPLPNFGRDFVYSIAAVGAQRLFGQGEYALCGKKKRDGYDRDTNVVHSLELNRIHLSLLEKYPQARWTPSGQIRSQNELTEFGYAKDYDAIIEAQPDDRDLRFALEYERTPKAQKRYEGIATGLSKEKRIGHLVYLAANSDLLSYVYKYFASIQHPVYFGRVNDWHRLVLDTPVVANCFTVALPLRQALK